MLKKTSLVAKIEGLYVNPSRESGLVSVAQQKVNCDYTGIQGESHGGETRLSCSRVGAQYPKKTEIRNVRQISLISREELQAIADNMGIPELDPSWLGPNILVSGIPDFSLIPPSSRLITAAGTSLTVDMCNGPCRFVGDVIEAHYPGKGKFFVKAALNMRGVTAWVECCGELKVGDEFVLHVPKQPHYPHADQL
ncbi:MAG: MOSC domain-containing protein [Pseudomonadales bacterium]